MNETQRKALEKAGWKFGTVQDMLGLSDTEAELIAARAKLASEVRSRRASRRLSQPEFAKILKTSQSRVSLIEAADPGVSLDQLVKAMMATGATLKEVGDAIGSACLAPPVPTDAAPRARSRASRRAPERNSRLQTAARKSATRPKND